MKERVNRGDIGRAQPCMGLFGSFWYSCIFLRYPSQLNHLIESLNWITWGEAGWSQFSRSLEIESISADLAQTRHGFCCPAGMCPINHKVGGLCFDGSPISLLCFCDLVRLPSCWMAEMFDLHQFPEFDPHLHSILRCPRYSAVFAMFFCFLMTCSCNEAYANRMPPCFAPCLWFGRERTNTPAKNLHSAIKLTKAI